MNPIRVTLLAAVFAFASVLSAQSILITNVQVYDGTGGKPYKADLRINGDTISEIAPKLKPAKGDTIVDGKGHALSPGFIDMHSHADLGIFEKSHDAVIRQGITTVLVGQDGGSVYPLKDFFAKLDQNPPAMNVASMAGHGTIRQQVMGNDLLRKATQREIDKMHNLLHDEMMAGAMGMSSGLEYDPMHYSSTDEIVQLAKMVKGHGGFFNAHVRDEGNGTLTSWEEMYQIAKEAKLPVVITHIKLGSTPVWHQAAKKVPTLFAKADANNVDLKADVYPYTSWHSALRVIMLDRDYYNPEKVRKAIVENGGADGLRITSYKPDKSVEDKTLAEIAKMWNVTPEEAFMRLVKATYSDDRSADTDAEVMGTGMSEDDVKWFVANPRIMFCTDGELDGKHPRGAGSFPRIMGRYVREQKALSLEMAIHKATALAAAQLDLADRGKIAKGMKADLVLFDPAAIIDRATVDDPLAPPVGIDDVMVNGVFVVKDGQPTKARSGRALRHPQPPALQ
jgi:N-acyl-D-amino-acid deacylase